MCQKVQKKCTNENSGENFHWPFVDGKKSRSRCKMPGCTGFTHIFCTKCHFSLCITSTRNCFYAFHNPAKTTNKKQQQRGEKTSMINLKKVSKSNGNNTTPSSNLDKLPLDSIRSKRKLPADSESGGRCSRSSKNSSTSPPAKKAKYETRSSTSRIHSESKSSIGANEDKVRRHFTRKSVTSPEALMKLDNKKEAANKTLVGRVGKKKSQDAFLSMLGLKRSDEM